VTRCKVASCKVASCTGIQAKAANVESGVWWTSATALEAIGRGVSITRDHDPALCGLARNQDTELYRLAQDLFCYINMYSRSRAA
jgi:hypothetical protein